MLVIKNYIIDDKKIHAKIEEIKRNQKSKWIFARLQKAMEEAEKQKKARRR